jgi:hypothetical protein
VRALECAAQARLGLGTPAQAARVEPVRTSDKEIVVRARLYLLSSLLVLCLLVLAGCGGKGGGY